MFSSVSRTIFMSRRLAPSAATATGTPAASARTDRLVPFFDRSTGLLPVFFPPERVRVLVLRDQRLETLPQLVRRQVRPGGLIFQPGRRVPATTTITTHIPVVRVLFGQVLRGMGRPSTGMLTGHPGRDQRQPAG